DAVLGAEAPTCDCGDEVIRRRVDLQHPPIAAIEAVAIGDIEVAGRVKRDSTHLQEALLYAEGAFDERLCATAAGVGRDDPGCVVDPTDRSCDRLSDVDVSVARHRHAGWLENHRAGGRAAIATRRSKPGAGDGRDHTGGCDLPNRVA